MIFSLKWQATLTDGVADASASPEMRPHLPHRSPLISSASPSLSSIPGQPTSTENTKINIEDRSESSS